MSVSAGEPPRTPARDDAMTDSAGPDPASRCSQAELRQLFLFEKLSGDQLDWLCRKGWVEEAGPGLVYREGEPAARLYVLLSGEVVLTRRIAGDDVEVTRTSARGAYGGAFAAYLGDRVQQVYNNSMRATEPSRFFVLRAAAFSQLMNDWFPMAVHLLEGLTFGQRNTQEAIGQRERLLALGSLTAGLAHELNNPAAAALRATGALRERIAGMRQKLAKLASGRLDGSFLSALTGLQEEAVARAAKGTVLSPLEASDLEDAVTEWLDGHGIAQGWDLAPTFVQAGLETSWLDRVAATVAEQAVGAGALDSAVRWLGYTVEIELLMGEITDSVNRVSSLVSAARQYSQLDRAPFQVVDVHELLDATLAMLGAKIGTDIRVVRDYDRGLPRIPGYPAELNQVWTNLIDNAVWAMDGNGTLTIRTGSENDYLVVDITDTGPGILADIQTRIFEPFFTTKPVGEGTGLGLDISWRIVVNRHHGDLRVESVPGNTTFRVRLPLAGPEPGKEQSDDEHPRS
ncbi:MAG TPA: ATP-binding protein [Streptosporangiaceae bacterium]|nr:ATP-binding protein [Streptosporangiaceae bacterium]